MIDKPGYISITDALKLLRERGVSQPEGELLQALRDGRLHSCGLVAMTLRGRSKPAAWRQLKPAWWHHLNSLLDNNDVVYFDERLTKPPTPFRAEQVEVPRALLHKFWPEPLAASTGAGELDSANKDAPANPRRPGRSRPARERARRAIDELYPEGIPDQATVPNKLLCERVSTKLKDATLPAVKDDTILRAAGRRK